MGNRDLRWARAEILKECLDLVLLCLVLLPWLISHKGWTSLRCEGLQRYWMNKSHITLLGYDTHWVNCQSAFVLNSSRRPKYIDALFSAYASKTRWCPKARRLTAYTVCRKLKTTSVTWKISMSRTPFIDWSGVSKLGKMNFDERVLGSGTTGWVSGVKEG